LGGGVGFGGVVAAGVLLGVVVATGVGVTEPVVGDAAGGLAVPQLATIISITPAAQHRTAPRPIRRTT
jgi:hypothetical protein